MTFEHVVIVLDDDQTMLKALERLLTAEELQVRTFEKAEDFFKWELPEAASCLLLDHHLGDGMTGVQVHAELQRRGWDIPTVFLTAHWNVQSVVRAMRAEKSVGRAMASSSALVWSDCVPPSTAAIASTVVRITLL